MNEVLYRLSHATLGSFSDHILHLCRISMFGLPLYRRPMSCKYEWFGLPTEPCHHAFGLYKLPLRTDNKDNISNCLPPLNPLIIGLSGDRGGCSQRFTCRSGSVVRPTGPACLLAHLPEIGWLRCWLSVGFVAGNKKISRAAQI